MEHQVFRTADGIHTQELDGEMVILNILTEHYIALNPSATDMWKILIETGSVEETCERFREMYDVDPTVLRRDLDALIAQMLHYKLIEVQLDEA